MKQTDKKRTPTNNQTKRSVRSQSRDNKQLQEKANQLPKSKNTDTKVLSEDSSQNIKIVESNQENTDQVYKPNNNLDEESDSETVTDSVSSSGDSRATEDEKLEPGPTVSQNPAVKDNKVKSVKSPSSSITKNTTSDNNSTVVNVKIHPTLSSAPSSVSSEGLEDQNDQTTPESKEVDMMDDDETKEDLDQKIEEMEMRIEKLEDELREVAALEISLYSVVPEHGSSAHKVHTPARRLSRLYIHASKHYSQSKRATIAKNTASGLVLIAKSCGNDVPRLTFWWSNTIVLRETILQTFGSSCQSSSSPRTLNTNGSNKQFHNKPDFIEFIDDYQETRTFASALEKVESWIFSRIVESIWWQTLTPKMQPLGDDTNANKSIGKLLGPTYQQQNNFSINLWRIAFHDAFKRLCPVRAGGHDCGCLPVLARMVMEQCVARLDVAMFNAILRESAHEMPTDPVSDPILESRVLPIPAGDLSFSSGAQLKNAVGNWSRWLSDWFGLDTEEEHEHEHGTCEDVSEKVGKNGELKCFRLLNALSDLLMLPKDMLMEKSVRSEVCPSISLPLLKRILCNFTPDEFCPDSVPGAVLEAVNAESMIERSLSCDNSSHFPYTAAPVIYKPPSTNDVSQKVSEVGGKQTQLNRNSSVIQRKGYTSDEELEQLDSPLAYIIDKQPVLSLNRATNGNGQHMDQNTSVAVNTRYELLRDVWLS